MMLNRNPSSSSSNGSPAEAVVPASPSPSAPPVPLAKDPLAGAFPAWDLLPPGGFVKRVNRKKTGEAPTL